MPSINIHDGEGLPSQFLISCDEQVTIGRSVDCDIIVDSESLSGKHAVLESIGSSYQLRDLGSTNGIKKDGVRVDKIEILKDTEVTLGSVLIRINFNEKELLSLKPQLQPRVTLASAQKSSGVRFFIPLLLLAAGGVFCLHYMGYINLPLQQGVQDEKEEVDSSRELAVTVESSAPPEYLRVVVQKGGEDRTLVLNKMQTRRADYEVLVIGADGSTESLEAGVERNYSGYCEEEPDSLVAAYIHPDGSLTANVLKAEQIKGTGAKTDWEVNSVSDYRLLTEEALSPQGKSLEGAAWVDSNKRRHPLYDDNYSYDLGFEYQSTYIKNYSESSPAGYKQMQYRADYSNALFSLVSTRDLLLETKIAKVVIRKKDMEWGGIYRDWFKRFGETPIDTIAYMSGGGASGGFGYMKHDYHRHDFKVSLNGGAMPWLVFRHETGHYLGIGDMAGGAKEGATIINGNAFARWSMPALKGIIEVDRAKHLAHEKDKDVMVSIGKANIEVPPYAYADQVYLSQGAKKTLDVLMNDFDANGQQLALAGFEETSAFGGKITRNMAADGGSDTLEYQAPPEFTGLDRFSYSIVDKTGRVAHGNVLIHISKLGLQAHWDFENITTRPEIPSKGLNSVIARQSPKKSQLKWKQTEVEEVREWDVSKVLNQPGEYNVTFKFLKGDSAFVTEGCVLMLNGKTISRDVHTGAAGHRNTTKKNVYRLKLKEALNPTDELLLKAKVKLGKNRPNLSSEGAVLIEPYSKKKSGKRGNGLELDGERHLRLPRWKLNSESLTIAAWVNSESWAGGVWGPRIIQMAGRGQAWRLNAEHGKMAFCLGDIATKKWNAEGLLLAELPPVNEWVHIAAVSDGLTMKIYYNGELVAEKERVGPIEDAASGGMIGSKFKGVIDELYVFNRPLTQTQIKKLMRIK